MEGLPEVYIVRELKQIKALSDPLRQAIIGAMSKEPRTTKQVAVSLGQPVTKLYRHVEILEQAGLVTLVRTAPKRGTTEKYYQSIARSFFVAGDSLSPDELSEIELIFSRTFQEILDELRARIRTVGDVCDESEQKGFLASGSVRIPRGKLTEFQARLQSVMEEFGAPRSSEEPDYKFVLAIVPKCDPAE